MPTAKPCELPRRPIGRVLLACALLAAACAAPPPEPAPALRAAPDPEVYRRADAARLKLLEREVERLTADVRAAEETLVAIESGLRGSHTRAEVVSLLAEARIELTRAAKRAPWRAAEAEEARRKLDEADQELAAGHVGSALFFVSRSSRIAKGLLAEADRVARTQGTRRVDGSRVNLRAEASTESAVVAVLPVALPVFPELEEGEWVLVRTALGQVGWIHTSLLRAR
jgi:hypothetical protein